MKPEVLTIAGSDPTGGAGIQADLRTFDHFGARGLSAVTALTVQNSKGVSAVYPVEADIVFEQICALQSDRPIGGIKIGMLGNSSILEVVIEALILIQEESPNPIPVVLDPVLVSSSGFPLLNDNALQMLKEKLIPLASVLTPNLPEAYALLGMNIKSSVDTHELCRDLYKLGAENILLKGGHNRGPFSEDIHFGGKTFTQYKSVRRENVEVHGSGCMLSSALTANLALGKTIDDSLRRSKSYIDEIFEIAFKDQNM